MDTAILRSRILDLAIHGQLLPQNSADGSALDLLTAISQERGQKITPVTDGVPFDLPESWCWVRLGDIADIVTGSTPSKSHPEYYGGIFPFYKPADLDQGYVTKATEYLSEEGKKVSRVLPPKSVAICCIGTIGKVGVLQYESTTNQQINTAIPLGDLSHLLLYYFLQSSFMNRQLWDKSTGVTISMINKKNTESILFPLPPLAEQHRIVEKVEELLAAVDKIESAQSDIASAASILQSRILDLAIHGSMTKQEPSDGSALDLLAAISQSRGQKITPVTDGVPFDLPENWCWVRLGDIVSLLNGDRGENYPSKKSLSVEGDIPFISAINMHNQTIRNDNLLFLSQERFDLLRAGKLVKDDVVVCIRGSLGKCCIYPYKVGAIASSLVILRSKGVVDNLLLLHYISSSLFNSEIKKYNNGTAQPNLAAGDLKRFLFPLPPLAEQRRIVAKVESLFAAIDKLK